MDEALRWVRDKEAEAFSLSPNREPLDRDSVVRFIANATVLNELMVEGYENYAQRFVDKRYENEIWDKHQLKKFAIVEYPLAVIESVFLDEAKPLLREISVGIYPINGFNACAFRTPSGDPAVLFSEWLFSFLWDYYGEATVLYLEGKYDELIELEKEFGDMLVAGSYHNWAVQPIIDSEPQTNAPRWLILLALVYIFAHEIGHILLGHTDAAIIESRNVDLYEGKRDKLEIYSYSHIQEFDADMFASDVYFGFLHYGLKQPLDELFFRTAHLRGFSFLRILARLEEHNLMEDYSDTKHPPSVIREAYMKLRHKDKLIDLGLDVSDMEGIIADAADQIPEFDYTKHLHTDSFLG